MAKIFLHYLNPEDSLSDKYPVDERHESVRDFLVNFFVPDGIGPTNACYFILDKFLNPRVEIYEPMALGEIEKSLVCDLITCLATAHEKETQVLIITGTDVVELAKTLYIERADVPSVSFIHKEIDTCEIKTCRYISKEFSFPHTLHDRWMLQETSQGIKGVHLGPSLPNIRGKDITITYFDESSCRNALDRFHSIWRLCEQKRN